jgi:hypothetical protein
MLLLLSCLFAIPGVTAAADLPPLLLAEGKSWPGKILGVDHGQPGRSAATPMARFIGADSKRRNTAIRCPTASYIS